MSTFTEDVQKYECLNDRLNKNYRNKYTRLNCYKEIGQEFQMDREEAEKKYRIYGAPTADLFLRKKVPSGSEEVAVPSSEFNNLQWLANRINKRPTTRSHFFRRPRKPIRIVPVV